MDRKEEFTLEEGYLLECNGAGSVVTVPDGVCAIGSQVFAADCRDNVKQVILPEGLTHIAEEAFISCHSLETVRLPRSLTHLGNSAFACCNRLQFMDIPQGIRKIDEAAFVYCRYLKRLSLPDTVTTIESRAFSHCERLPQITFPKELKTIGRFAFHECTALPEVLLPRGLTFIGQYAFYNCTGLLRLVLPDTVRQIENNAFERCDQLQQVQIAPQTVEALGEDGVHRVFGSTAYVLLRKILLDPQGYDPDFRQWLLDWGRRPKPLRKMATDLVEEGDLPALAGLLGLKRRIPLAILQDLLESAQQLQQTQIVAWLIDYRKTKYSRQYIREAEQRAERKLLGLDLSPVELWRREFRFTIRGDKIYITGYKGDREQVIIPGYIDRYRVVSVDLSRPVNGKRKIDAVRSLVLGEGITHIKPYAFRRMWDLEEVILPDTIEEIGEGAFRDCGALKQVRLPSKSFRIGPYAFTGCHELISLDLPGDMLRQYGHTWLRRCTGTLLFALIEADLRDDPKVSAAMAEAFRSWTRLPSWRKLCIGTFNDTDEEDLLRKFLERCGKIPLGEINRYLTSRRDKVFKDVILEYRSACYTQKQIEESEQLLRDKAQGKVERTVGDWRQFFRFYLRDGQAHITGCIYPEETLTVPAAIGKYPVTSFCLDPEEKLSFWRFHMTKVRKIIFLAPLTDLGPGAFSGCASLETVIFPETLQSLHAHALYYCEDIRTVELPPSLTYIGEKAFYTANLRAIQGVRGSYAQTYAKQEGIPFVSVSSAQQEVT